MNAKPTLGAGVSSSLPQMTRPDLTPPTPAPPLTPPPALPPVMTRGESQASAPADDAKGSPPRLAARGFRLFYGRHQALKSITLEIPDRSVTAIIGPSGCGKSTLLRSFNRMNDLIPGVRTLGGIAVSGVDVMAPGTDV